MPGWIFDENISRATVKEFAKAGVRGVHIKDDLNLGGVMDEVVLLTAKEKKATLITANTRDFLNIPDVDYHNSYGAWILQTEDPDEQVRLIKATLEVTGLDTLKKRKELKLHLKGNSVTIVDCRNQSETTLKLPPKKR